MLREGMGINIGCYRMTRTLAGTEGQKDIPARGIMCGTWAQERGSSWWPLQELAQSLSCGKTIYFMRNILGGVE